MQMHLRHIRGCNCNLHLNINMQRQLHLQFHLHFSSCICVSHPPTTLTAPLANNKASTCVREQAQACGRHLISVPVNRCVICIEKDKNNLNEHKSGVSLQSRTKFTCWDHMTDWNMAYLFDYDKPFGHLNCLRQKPFVLTTHQQETYSELSSLCQLMF